MQLLGALALALALAFCVAACASSAEQVAPASGMENAGERSGAGDQIADIACDATLFSQAPKVVLRHLREAYFVAATTSDEPTLFNLKGNRVVEGQVDFQPGDQLYGVSVSAAPRLRLLRLVFTDVRGGITDVSRRVASCAGKPSSATGRAASWRLPVRRIIALEQLGSDQLEFTLSVDESDIAN